MADLETLRPEVREAVFEIDCYPFDCKHNVRHWKNVRAELLRLASENMELRGENKRIKFLLDSAEAELTSLKARIADGWLCGVSNDACPGNFDAAIYCLPSRFRGKRVRLVVEE